MEGEDTSNATIAFASGARPPLRRLGGRATRHGYAIHAHGEGGLLVADLTAGRLYAHRPWAGEAPRGGLSGRRSPDPATAERAPKDGPAATRPVL